MVLDKIYVEKWMGWIMRDVISIFS